MTTNASPGPKAAMAVGITGAALIALGLYYCGDRFTVHVQGKIRAGMGQLVSATHSDKLQADASRLRVIFKGLQGMRVRLAALELSKGHSHTVRRVEWDSDGVVCVEFNEAVPGRSVCVTLYGELPSKNK